MWRVIQTHVTFYVLNYILNHEIQLRSSLLGISPFLYEHYHHLA